MRAKKPQSCLTLCDPMDCSLTGTFVHGILQARILEWVVKPFSKGSSRPRDPTCVSCSPCIAGGFFTATREARVGVLFKDLSALMLGPVSFLCNSALSCQTSNVFFFFFFFIKKVLAFVEDLFMCLLAICMSLQKSLFRPFPHF